MIQLERIRTRQAVTGGLCGPALIAKNIALIKAKLSGSLDDPHARYWADKSRHWKAAKRQLKAETYGKCAYCESPVDQVAHGDVEHFRPKCRYWWLAYCYDNYLYACQICNQVHKLDHFEIAGPPMSEPCVPESLEHASERSLKACARHLSPDPLDDSQGQTVNEFQRQARIERAHFVDPYVSNPEPLFRWVPDEILQEVALGARGKSAVASRAYRAAVEHLGLNREELRHSRWVLAYEYLDEKRLILRELAAAGITGSVRDRIVRSLRSMMAPNQPYAGMVRYFVKVKWKRDIQLPVDTV